MILQKKVSCRLSMIPIRASAKLWIRKPPQKPIHWLEQINFRQTLRKIFHPDSKCR